MSDTHATPPPGPDQVGAAQDEQDAIAQMREHLASVSAGDMVAETAVPLITLAYMRLGLPPEHNERYRDLEAARLLIDALGGLLEAVQGRLGAVEPGLREALAGLRLAFVDVAGHTQAGGHQPAPDQPAPAPQPSGRRPSGLWVPGQP